jgi:hypothetical protein
LAIYEIPAGGYPNIKKAIKLTKNQGYYTILNGRKHGLPDLALIRCAFNALEEKLERMMK